MASFVSISPFCPIELIEGSGLLGPHPSSCSSSISSPPLALTTANLTLCTVFADVMSEGVDKESCGRWTFIRNYFLFYIDAGQVQFHLSLSSSLLSFSWPCGRLSWHVMVDRSIGPSSVPTLRCQGRGGGFSASSLIEGAPREPLSACFPCVLCTNSPSDRNHLGNTCLPQVIRVVSSPYYGYTPATASILQKVKHRCAAPSPPLPPFEASA